jgi:hypothetical protein
MVEAAAVRSPESWTDRLRDRFAAALGTIALLAIALIAIVAAAGIRAVRRHGELIAIALVVAVIVAIALLMFGGPARADNGILREDMTESEVQQSLGRPPDESKFQQCGSSTPHPWPCTIWIYTAKNGDLLAIFYRYDNGEWVVNSWRMRYHDNRTRP